MEQETKAVHDENKSLVTESKHATPQTNGDI